MTDRKLRTIIRQLISESSNIGTLSGGNNSARWTAPGQQKRIRIEQLSGYSQIDFPTADSLDISNEKHQWAGVSQTKKYHNKVRATRQTDGTLKLENTMKKSQLRQIIKEVIQEETEYQTLVKQVMDMIGIDSPQDLDDDKRAKFFSYLNTIWDKGAGKKRKEPSKDAITAIMGEYGKKKRKKKEYKK